MYGPVTFFYMATLDGQNLGHSNPLRKNHLISKYLNVGTYTYFRSEAVPFEISLPTSVRNTL